MTILTIIITIAWLMNFQVSYASKIISVPDDYTTISLAIDHASQGDTVKVKQGIYNENLKITKTISLEGENREETIIIGNTGSNQPAVLTIAAPGIKISGFTIQSADTQNPNQRAYGINVQADNCTIHGNIIQKNYIGIFGSLQSSNIISNNLITLNAKDGIRFLGGSQNVISNNIIVANDVSGIALGGYQYTVEKNIIQNNFRGLGLGASYSIIFANKIGSNIESGIWLSGSKNVISKNDISTNKYGIFVTNQLAAPRANEIYQNNFLHNTNNAYDNSSYLVEIWDNGNPSGGNYWSDQENANTPYAINPNNIDNHPLDKPFNTSNPGTTPTAIYAASPPTKGVIALWTFDIIESGGVIPESTGNNPAILGSTVGNRSFIPKQVAGQFGQALSFDGDAYAFVLPSPSLHLNQEVTIDAWINVQEIKSNSYNNILVACRRTTQPLPYRVFGLAINGEPPQNSSSPPIGIVRGYVMTQDGVLNEINTKQSLPLNQWVHVVFAHSLTSGLQIYINDKEQQVTLISGSLNPTEPIIAQNELYVGHDSMTQIDQLQINNYAHQQTQPLWQQWWIWTILLIGLMLSVLFYFKRHNSNIA